MLELPEIETYKKLLSEQIINKLITEVRVAEEKLVNLDPAEFVNELTGQEVLFIERRGKFLLFHLDNGRRLLLHLGLTGSMHYGPQEDEEHQTGHLAIAFGTNVLSFNGLRQGYLHMLSVKDADSILSDLGPELLDRRMTLAKFKELFNKKRGMLKSALVQQNFVAGLGNVYADEIAFDAALLPSVKLQELSEETIERLYRSVQHVLTEAIEQGGVGEQHFSADDTLTGGYRQQIRVYDREGQSCPRCGAKIQKTEVGSRKTYFCGECQGEH
ncbi:DNA-formamidopyrimidine glycosylase [Paenibacillus selenitireducens]|uniref:Formamidopyrimidine-DNA glycosylase n=1 Tax=Paenibacillus selenitireducens TaxID=1324314 RepID=A0A1T2X488_9BACL|nr:bifunctional DNA-formamidopyrimidine glycosylase/DNA-(apurinic or apyrimidinic site) lyase [Paenibacillus selenitireducens]OPA74662.1 DNA-formamidopyrimidine glycosylase [Paenibacillus selenitireducens]